MNSRINFIPLKKPPLATGTHFSSILSRHATGLFLHRDPHKSALSSNSTSTELDTIIKDFLDDDDDDDEVLELFQPPGEFRPSNNPSTTRELQSMISDRQKTKYVKSKQWTMYFSCLCCRCYPVVLVGGCSLKMGANCTSEQRFVNVSLVITLACAHRMNVEFVGIYVHVCCQKTRSPLENSFLQLGLRIPIP